MEATQSEADAILRRAAFRLVPLILAMYVASFLNRVNVGFAALTMNHDLGFSPGSLWHAARASSSGAISCSRCRPT